jgi:hypothetical protein
MIEYITEDGESIKGDSPMELVEALRDGSKFAHNQSNGQYMEGYSERAFNVDSHKIRFDSPEYFIQDLLLCGYLRRV